MVDLGDISRVVDIHKRLRHLKSPAGTRDSPARTCLDLHLENPSIHDGILILHKNDSLLRSYSFPGFYWIDPNGGCISDAVEVFCNFSNSQQVKTCITANNRESSVKAWIGSSVWFSSLKDGYKVLALINIQCSTRISFFFCR